MKGESAESFERLDSGASSEVSVIVIDSDDEIFKISNEALKKVEKAA